MSKIFTFSEKFLLRNQQSFETDFSEIKLPINVMRGLITDFLIGLGFKIRDNNIKIESNPLLKRSQITYDSLKAEINFNSSQDLSVHRPQLFYIGIILLIAGVFLSILDGSVLNWNFNLIMISLTLVGVSILLLKYFNVLYYFKSGKRNLGRGEINIIDVGYITKVNLENQFLHDTLEFNSNHSVLKIIIQGNLYSGLPDIRNIEHNFNEKTLKLVDFIENMIVENQVKIIT